MSEPVRYQESISKLNEMIKGIQIAMFTTVDENGTLHSRPMAAQQTPCDGELWFFTAKDSAKTSELRSDQRVNIVYSDPDTHRYASVSGIATSVDDKKKAAELWTPMLRVWFSKGLDDPNLRLVRVKVQKAEIWNALTNKVERVLGLVKSLAAGDPLRPGENHKLEMTG